MHSTHSMKRVLGVWSSIKHGGGEEREQGDNPPQLSAPPSLTSSASGSGRNLILECYSTLEMRREMEIFLVSNFKMEEPSLTTQTWAREKKELTSSKASPL